MSRFGDRYKVSEAFKQKLNDWPTIRPGDAEGLRKFSDFLQHCSSAMTSIIYLDSLNSAEENRKLIVKLPRYIADRWNRVIDRWLYKDEREQSSYLLLTQGRYPPFSAFCRFIEDEARVACGPGNVSSLSTMKGAQGQSVQQTKSDKRKAGSFVSQANESTDESTKDVKPEKSSTANKTTSQPQCLFCKSPHTIDKCQKFLKKPGDEKKTFVSAHGLCFGCLRRGHLYSSCRKKNPSLMKDATTEASHADQEKPQEEPPDDKDATDSAMSLRTDARDVLDDGNNCVHSMILPVIVHHSDDPDNEILTYALLDNQSDACFVGENLLQQLKTTSERVTLELTTVLAKQVVESQVVRGLVVTGLHQDVEIPLPATYSRNCIPASKNLIPRPETVQQWPHLRDVELHPLQENTEIGLLIGINCSRALLPREVVAAGDDDPYAIRTALGWGVTGNMSPSTDDAEGHGSSSHFAFRTSAKEITPVEVLQMFEQSSTNQRRLLRGQLELHQHDIKDNPADIASRGVSAKQLINDAPQPVHHSTMDSTLSEDDPEVKKVTVHSTTISPDECVLLQRLEYFSTWYRTQRAIAVCFKFVRKLRERIAKKQDKNDQSGKRSYTPVNVDDMQHAERVIQEFPEEVKLLTKPGKQKSKVTTKRRSRVRRANVPRDLAHHVILLIVLMMSENVQRNQWPKAIVVDTYPSDDGCVCKVAVKTSSATFDRPIHKLTLLCRPGIPTEGAK
jgi:hypothetical protein